MKKVLIAIIAVVMLISCEKEENKPECEINNTGTLQIINDENDPYRVYIDNQLYITLLPNTHITFSLSEGKHPIKIIQDDGYCWVCNPSEKDYEISIYSCQEELILIN